MKKVFHLQFHLFKLAALRVGRPFSSFIGPGIPDIRAQNDLRLAASFSVFGFGAGALRFDPVAALILARPLAVKPAPLDTGSFSPRPTAREGVFLAIEHRCGHACWSSSVDAGFAKNTFARNHYVNSTSNSGGDESKHHRTA